MLSATSLNFFFQAEDGIRDRNVTGVQTCALPISLMGYERFGFPWRFHLNISRSFTRRSGLSGRFGGLIQPVITGLIFCCMLLTLCSRSEERRVGKECRLHTARKPRSGCEAAARSL